MRELTEFDILDTLPEQAYDAITYLASQICDVPIALISIVDEDRQWFKSRVGLDAHETHRDLAFCAHAIHRPEELLIVTDASADDRFLANPLVTGDPNIRFYAGAPLVTKNGNALGTICVIDRSPRQLTAEQEQALRALSLQVMSLLDLRKTVRELERKRAELEEANHQREVLMATVSHELRTPLTALMGFIEFLEDDLDDETRADIVSRMGRQAGDLQHLIEDLLIATRAEVDALTVESVPVDVRQQIELAIDDVSRGGAPSLVIEADDVRCVADPARVRQIIRNLLTNARRYGGPNITLRAGEMAGRCVLQVIDDGPGIPLEEREQVFEQFKRSSTAIHIAASAGLGLPLSRMLAETMGGSLVYRYEAGHSIFELSLPPASVAARSA